jgi:phage shock protein PspC (stress-responsive transcriptional regulator)
MQRVISINLNGNAYQLDESGYDRLRDYLADAERQLKENPDRVEIMADLEQAIADKCGKYLGPTKTVVSASEVDQIVVEMGPVDNAAGAADDHAAASGKPGTGAGEQQAMPPRRLHRIPNGAMIAGVCNGLAAYFRIDVTMVRIAFVAAAILTKGAGIMAYVFMMFVVPEAKTAEAHAAAAGEPLNAKDVIERAKKQYAEGSRQVRREWQRQRRQWRRQGWPPGAPIPYAPAPWLAVLLPVFGFVHVALFLVMAAMMISLVNTGAILKWELPIDVPVWAGALILLIAYQIAVSPFRAFQHWASFPRPGAEPAWLAFWNAVTWLVGMAFVVWIASNHVPEIREFLQHVPGLIRDFAHAVRDVVNER